MNEQLVKDIQESLRILRKRGWCQFTYLNMKGKVCLTGAMRVAISGHPYRFMSEDETARMRAAYDAVYAVTITKPEKFNDARGRKRREVVRVLKQAKKAAEA